MLTPAQIQELQEAYGAVKTMDPSSKTYESLITFLDACDDRKLVLLAEAGIKWVSMLANNRIIFRKMNGQWSREYRLGPHHDALIAEAKRLVGDPDRV